MKHWPFACQAKACLFRFNASFHSVGRCFGGMLLLFIVQYSHVWNNGRDKRRETEAVRKTE